MSGGKWKNNHRSEDSDSLNLSEAFHEKLILHKYMMNSEHASLIHEHCEARYFDDSTRRALFGIMRSIRERLCIHGLNYPVLSRDTVMRRIEGHKEKPRPDEKDVDFRQMELLLDSLVVLQFDEDEVLVKDYVLKFLKAKGVYFAILDGLAMVEHKNIDTEECIDRFQRIHSMTFDNNLGLDYFGDFDKHLEYLSKPESRIPTGFRTLDIKMNNGLLKDGKCLAVFMGSPGVGKSLILGNLAVNFLMQKMKVLIITLEMSEQVYAQRIDSALTSRPVRTLHNDGGLHAAVAAFHRDHRESVLRIKEYPPSSISSSVLRNYVQKLEGKGFKPDVVLVDYLNLMVPAVGGKDNMYERVGTVTQELRGLSYSLGVPIVTATQTNRGGVASNNPDMSNTSESMGIPQISDFFCALYQNDGDRESQIIRGRILKNRLGGHISTADAKSHLMFSINYDTLRMTEFEHRQEESMQVGIDDIVDMLK